MQDELESILKKYCFNDNYNIISKYEVNNKEIKLEKINYSKYLNDIISENPYEYIEPKKTSERSRIIVPSQPVKLPTAEEIEEAKKAQKRWEMQSAIATRFGTSSSVLTEDEMQRLLEPAVDTTAGKWYLFLRGKGLALSLPQSMDGDFSAMMEEQARRHVRQIYCADTTLPLSSLWDIVNFGFEQVPTRQVISAAEGKRSIKNFPLGKVYETVSITGLKARLSPLEATLALVYGLIGRNKEKVKEAARVFEKGKLDVARKSIRNSHLSPGKIFRDIAPYLAQISSGSTDGALGILSYFGDNLKTEEVSDLVAGVSSLFEKEDRFSHLLVKMQDGRYEDMFDNSRLMACTFLPTGMYRGASLVYYHDPDIGLLQVVPKSIDKVLAPVGVAILANASDERGDRWLVVDSVEGGVELERVKDRLWMPGIYQGVLSVARDVGARAVMFNSSVYNGRPRRFLEHVAKQAPQSRVCLRKTGMQDYSGLGVSQLHAKEALETWAKSTNNEVNGYVVQLN